MVTIRITAKFSGLADSQSREVLFMILRNTVSIPKSWLINWPVGGIEPTSNQSKASAHLVKPRRDDRYTFRVVEEQNLLTYLILFGWVENWNLVCTGRVLW